MGEKNRGERPSYEPAKTADYLKKQYWDARFEAEEEYDWFKRFEEFSHLVVPHLGKNDRILILGCGNSSLTFDLYKLGYQQITSIDLSEAITLLPLLQSLLRDTHAREAKLS